MKQLYHYLIPGKNDILNPMKPVNWTPIFRKYPGKWVVLKQNEVTVVSASKSVKVALKKAKEKGSKLPILLKVPTESIPYVGGSSSIE